MNWTRSPCLCTGTALHGQSRSVLTVPYESHAACFCCMDLSTQRFSFMIQKNRQIESRWAANDLLVHLALISLLWLQPSWNTQRIGIRGSPTACKELLPCLSWLLCSHFPVLRLQDECVREPQLLRNLRRYREKPSSFSIPSQRVLSSRFCQTGYRNRKSRDKIPISCRMPL